MTTREDARIALVTKVEALKATWTNYPLEVEYRNSGNINYATQSNPYLSVDIIYTDGTQLNLSYNPGHRLMGTIILEAWVKEGTGTAQANALLQHFYPAIHMRDTIPPLRTLAARFASPPAKDGWVAETALIPFWFDSIP